MGIYYTAIKSNVMIFFSFSRTLGVECHIVTPSEIQEICPTIRVDDLQVRTDWHSQLRFDETVKTYLNVCMCTDVFASCFVDCRSCIYMVGGTVAGFNLASACCREECGYLVMVPWQHQTSSWCSPEKQRPKVPLFIISPSQYGYKCYWRPRRKYIYIYIDLVCVL